MSGEIPFAGHPSLGTAVAVARARGESRRASCSRPSPASSASTSRSRAPPRRPRCSRSRLRSDPNWIPPKCSAIAGLAPDDADPELPVQVVSTGAAAGDRARSRDPAALGRARPDYDAIGPLLATHDAIVYYLVASTAGTVRARSFLRTAEMGEDPATGAAAGPLCAYVAQRTGVEAVEIDQGVEMGRAEPAARLGRRRPRARGRRRRRRGRRHCLPGLLTDHPSAPLQPGARRVDPAPVALIPRRVRARSRHSRTGGTRRIRAGTVLLPRNRPAPSGTARSTRAARLPPRGP